MKLTRRAFHRNSSGVAAIVAIAMLWAPAYATVPPRDEALVLGRATDIDLSAQETAVMFEPVSARRRPSQKTQRKRGEKPAALRTWVVLRDVMAAKGAPVYDLFLVLEGRDVFRPTTTTQPVGALELGTAGGENGFERKEALAFDVSEALAKLSKVRGYRMQHLRLSIVRRPAKDALDKEAADKEAKEAAPPAPRPPEIGTIELVRW